MRGAAPWAPTWHWPAAPGGLEALPPGFEHSHQALETLVRWELRLVGQLDQMQVRTQACWVSLHPRTPSGLESHRPRLAEALLHVGRTSASQEGGELLRGTEEATVTAMKTLDCLPFR